MLIIFIFGVLKYNLLLTVCPKRIEIQPFFGQKSFEEKRSSNVTIFIIGVLEYNLFLTGCQKKC